MKVGDSPVPYSPLPPPTEKKNRSWTWSHIVLKMAPFVLFFLDRLSSAWAHPTCSLKEAPPPFRWAACVLPPRWAALTVRPGMLSISSFGIPITRDTFGNLSRHLEKAGKELKNQIPQQIVEAMLHQNPGFKNQVEEDGFGVTIRDTISDPNDPNIKKEVSQRYHLGMNPQIAKNYGEAVPYVYNYVESRKFFEGDEKRLISFIEGANAILLKDLNVEGAGKLRAEPICPFFPYTRSEDECVKLLKEKGVSSEKEIDIFVSAYRRTAEARNNERDWFCLLSEEEAPIFKKIIHIPPQRAQEIQIAIERLAKGLPELNPDLYLDDPAQLIRNAAEIHQIFIREHFLTQANGRLARLLTLAMLAPRFGWILFRNENHEYTRAVGEALVFDNVRIFEKYLKKMIRSSPRYQRALDNSDEKMICLLRSPKYLECLGRQVVFNSL